MTFALHSTDLFCSYSVLGSSLSRLKVCCFRLRGVGKLDGDRGGISHYLSHERAVESGKKAQVNMTAVFQQIV